MNKAFVNSTKSIVVVIAMSLLFSCTFKNSGFHISGEIKHVAAGTKIYLEELGFSAIVALDTSTIEKDGRFDMKGYLKHEALYRLRFGADKYMMLVLNEKKQDITVVADTVSFIKHPYTIKGSPVSNQLQDFMLNINKRYQDMQVLFGRVNDSINPPADSLKKVYEAEIEKKATDARTYITQYIDTVADPVLGIFTAYYFLNPKMDLPAFIKLSAKLKKSYPDLPLAKSFMDEVAKVERQLNPGDQNQPMFANGTQLPDIEMNDVNNKSLKLSSLKGKYVLVDFWASWCGPCRAENPGVVKAYNDFKDKGFTVFSVSLDDDHSKWVAAIAKDKLIWPCHVSELKGWQSQICQQFGITAIPTNYLIDKDGKVIASDLRGNELGNILKQTLK